jgi:hypothetical protein
MKVDSLHTWRGYALSLRDRHFHQRLFKRYGIHLLEGEYQQLIQKVQSGQVANMAWGQQERRPDQNTRYLVILRREEKGVVKEIPIHLAYDVKTKRFVTALEPVGEIREKYIEAVVAEPTKNHLIHAKKGVDITMRCQSKTAYGSSL